jgi:hypothetical protein
LHFRFVMGLLAAVSGSAATAAAPSALAMFATQFPGRVLAAHNNERLRAGVGPLTWDNQLGVGAAAYAQQLAIAGRFAHSDRSNRPGIGENLWMGTHGAFNVEAMVGAWASEKQYFIPGMFPNVSRTGDWEDVGHYTQMIWPATGRIGCALASTPRIDYLVCRYAAAGNVEGRAVGLAGRR